MSGSLAKIMTGSNLYLEDVLHELYWTLPVFLDSLSFFSFVRIFSSSFFLFKVFGFFMFIGFSFFFIDRQSSREHLHKVSWLLWMWGISFYNSTVKCKSIQEQNTLIHSPLDCILLTLQQQHLQGHFANQTHIGEMMSFRLLFLVEAKGLE